MMQSFDINTHYLSGSLSLKTRHATSLSTAIDNLFKEEMDISKIVQITIKWKPLGDSRGQEGGVVG